ncbi:MAG: thiol reductant ABC exporter subunit CydD [Wenzhouxiangella sp.]
MPSSFALAAVEAISVIAVAGLLAWLLDRLILHAASATELVPHLAALLGAWALRAVAVTARGRLTAGASSQIRKELRQELFQRLVAAGPLYRGPRGSGQLSTGLIEQIDLLDPYYARYLPQTASALLVPGLILIAVFMTDWLAGALLLLAAPLIPGFMIIIGMGAQQISQGQQEALGRLSGLFFDRLQGLDTIKRFGAEQRELERMQSFSEQFRVRTMQVLRVAFLSSAVLEFFSAVAIATLAIYIGLGLLGMIDFAGADSLTLFKGLFILVLAPEFFNPLRTLANHWHDRAGAMASAGILRELLQAPAGRTEPGQGPARIPTDPCPIRVQGLSKRFPGRAAVLDGIDLEVCAGEKLLISGPSGCGKSTLLALMAGFGEPDQGRIEIDGTDLRQFTRAQLADIRGYLGQRPLLLADSLEQNIRFGDEQADAASLAKALDLSGVSAFLPRLPAGLETRLGESGHGISGGQARRVALARVLLKARPILLLDEPTASLDADTELAFWRALDEVLAQQPMTVVCTSHSPQAEVWADRMLRLRHGRIEEARHA